MKWNFCVCVRDSNRPSALAARTKEGSHARLVPDLPKVVTLIICIVFSSTLSAKGGFNRNFGK